MKQIRLLSTRSQAQDRAASQPAPPAQEQPTHIEEIDDETLILSICEGKEQAMEALYTRYSRYAYSLAYRILHDSAAAEDIVQEAFLSVWRKAASYQTQQGSVRSWLQAIIHHRAIDRVRASAHRDQYVTQLEPEHEQEIVSEQPEVWEEAWQREQAVVIRSALEQLPQEQRLVIGLAYFGGYTHSEISERWHIPLGTVKGRMRLGLQKMRQLLQARGIDNL
jgi:RNA polymerase sigma-70 factor (ECF subfamily)